MNGFFLTTAEHAEFGIFFNENFTLRPESVLSNVEGCLGCEISESSSL